MAIFASPNIVTDGLVLYVDPGNNKSYVSGSTTIADLSGENNNGTLANGVAYTDDNMGSLIFDGVNDYISISSNFNSFGNIIGNGFTIELWMKTTSNVYSQILGTTNNGNSVNISISTNRGVSSRDNLNSPGATQFYLRDVNGAFLVGYITTNIYDGLWHNIKWRIVDTTSSYFDCYVDGVLQQINYTDQETLTSWSNFDFSLLIGCLNNRGTASAFSNIEIAKTSIYNRALTEAEIKQSFNALRGRFGL